MLVFGRRHKGHTFSLKSATMSIFSVFFRPLFPSSSPPFFEVLAFFLFQVLMCLIMHPAPTGSKPVSRFTGRAGSQDSIRYHGQGVAGPQTREVGAGGLQDGGFSFPRRAEVRGREMSRAWRKRAISTSSCLRK